MIRTLVIVVCLSALVPTVNSVAGNASSPAVSPRRLLNDCMTKHMYADKTLSYNDARKSCRDELKQHGQDLAANNSPKSGTLR